MSTVNVAGSLPWSDNLPHNGQEYIGFKSRASQDGSIVSRCNEAHLEMVYGHLQAMQNPGCHEVVVGLIGV